MITDASQIDQLFTAIQAGDLEGLRALLTLDPTLASASHASGLTPLMLATYHRQLAAADLLQEAGAELDLFAAAALGRTDRLTALLADRPALVTAHSHDGWTALHLAAHFGQLAAVELLLAKGAEVDARSTNQLANTPLHAAAAGRHTSVVELLLDHGADLNAQQHGGFTALHAAAQHGDPSLTKLLLSRGADPNLSHAGGQTALAIAGEHNHSAVVGLLRQPGAEHA